MKAHTIAAACAALVFTCSTVFGQADPSPSDAAAAVETVVEAATSTDETTAPVAIAEPAPVAQPTTITTSDAPCTSCVGGCPAVATGCVACEQQRPRLLQTVATRIRSTGCPTCSGCAPAAPIASCSSCGTSTVAQVVYAAPVADCCAPAPAPCCGPAVAGPACGADASGCAGGIAAAPACGADAGCGAAPTCGADAACCAPAPTRGGCAATCGRPRLGNRVIDTRFEKRLFPNRACCARPPRRCR